MPGKTYAVIMAGGKGERFWPLSTSRHPKQVLSLIGGKPLVALAVERLKGLIPKDRIIIITSADLVSVTAKAVPALPRGNIIGEPVGRDTAAVCALASAIVKSRDPEGLFCILTADHIIKEIPVFLKTLTDCFALAAAGDRLITIGMRPTVPSTGFGYIETLKVVSKTGSTKFLEAKRFVEKPDKKHAQQYVRAGNYYWNSGMFIWSVASIQRALGKHRPQLLDMANRIQKVVDTRRFKTVLADEYSRIEKISVDYAIMEKSDNISMALAAFSWDDVGSWVALENHFKKDSGGNVVIGTSEILQSEDNIVVSKGRLTAILGVSNLVVVQAENATLVCHKDKVQEVKKMVQHLSKSGKYKSML